MTYHTDVALFFMFSFLTLDMYRADTRAGLLITRRGHVWPSSAHTDQEGELWWAVVRNG